MLFSSHPRTHYRNAPVHEVICQLRFPTILSINEAMPAAFQEEIRKEFPQFSVRAERVPVAPGQQPPAQTMTVNNDELFPFGVMPMLTFSDTRLGDVD